MASHLDRFQELQRTNPIAAGIHYRAHAVAIEQEKLAREEQAAPPPAPSAVATPHAWRAHHLAQTQSAMAAALYRKAHATEIALEEAAAAERGGAA